MKKVVSASLIAMALLLLFAAPSLAWSRGHFHGGTRVFVGVGPGWWWGPPYPYPYYYYPPYYPYPYYPPAPAEPPVYIQQEPAPASSATPSVSAPAQQGYWYFCASSGQYYPQVSSCSEAWVKVPPRQD
jgi:hypothetical protein